MGPAFDSRLAQRIIFCWFPFLLSLWVLMHLWSSGLLICVGRPRLRCQAIPLTAPFWAERCTVANGSVRQFSRKLAMFNQICCRVINTGCWFQLQDGRLR
ncbi:hypothetical protein B0T25DRAFT_72109 [Lasiosphaeria hispida]|uniref:Uncharacterized protein n=1 Tax=Lasiosphaeria hispida TaxID=260671 RepID=A0AAJ0H5A7_9PEZI|nr:hypothetical protein B0T25DRAFT_72109 [Lasiosphaeria hispida]